MPALHCLPKAGRELPHENSIFTLTAGADTKRKLSRAGRDDLVLGARSEGSSLGKMRPAFSKWRVARESLISQAAPVGGTHYEDERPAV